MKVKMIKYLTIFLIPLLFVMGVMFLVTPQQQNAVFAGVAASGKCGDDVYWELSDEAWPTLRIYGTGDMYDYDIGDIDNYNMDNDPRPWKDKVTSLFGLVIEEGVEHIGNYAFSNAWNVRNSDFSIPSTVKTIGEYAFFAIGYLESLEIPNGVTSIGAHAFERTAEYTDLTIPSSVQTIGENCFANSRIENLTIENGVRTIGDEAFKGNNIESLTIPSSIESIGNSCFYNCDITSVSIPASLTHIGDLALGRCPLEEITIDSNNPVYNDGNGSNCIIVTATDTLIVGCKNTTIPSGVETIADGAFYECDGLTSIVIPEGVTSVGESAFAECEDLSTITLPASLVNIGDMAFMECMQITSISFSDNVQSIGQMTFAVCVSLQNLNIPAGVTDIGDMAFVACPSLTSITVDPNNPKYSDGNGSNCIIDTTSNTLVSGCVNSTIPDGVETIGMGAFAMTGITSITLPSSVTTIAPMAFVNCENLEEIIINTSNISSLQISEDAFAECPNLTTIYVPDAAAAAELESLVGESGLEVKIIDQKPAVSPAGTGVVEDVILPTLAIAILAMLAMFISRKRTRNLKK